MTETMERASGSLVNIVLGALILWVGQTTFQHAGMLATIDQKFEALDHQFASLDVRFQDNHKQHESLRNWLENVSSSMKENRLLQFSNKDGDKLQKLIAGVDSNALNLERKLLERIEQLELKLVALETRTEGLTHESELRWEVAQLKNALHESQLRQFGPTHLTAERPQNLPPVTEHK